MEFLAPGGGLREREGPARRADRPKTAADVAEQLRRLGGRVRRAWVRRLLREGLAQVARRHRRQAPGRHPPHAPLRASRDYWAA